MNAPDKCFQSTHPNHVVLGRVKVTQSSLALGHLSSQLAQDRVTSSTIKQSPKLHMDASHRDLSVTIVPPIHLPTKPASLQASFCYDFPACAKDVLQRLSVLFEEVTWYHSRQCIGTPHCAYTDICARTSGAGQRVWPLLLARKVCSAILCRNGRKCSRSRTLGLGRSSGI